MTAVENGPSIVIILADSDRRKIINPARELAGTVKDSFPSKRPKLRLWPSGDVSLWYETDFELADKHWRAPEGVLPEAAPRVAESPSLLNLVNGAQVSQNISESPGKPAAQRGLSGLTSYGGKMIRSGVSLLAEEYGEKKLTFCTITVPPIDIPEAAELFRQWGEFTRQLIQFVGRELKRSGQSPDVVLVSEIQEERGKSLGQPFLHIHAVWGNRRAGRGRYAVDVSRLRGWVRGFFSRAIGRDCGLPRVECELVKKSARGYIAKYASKGSGAVALFVEIFGTDALPRTWWGMSGSLRRAVKNAIVVSRAGAEFLNEVLPLIREEGRLSGDGLSLVAIWLGEPKASPLLGYAGRVWGQFERDLRQVCRDSYLAAVSRLKLNSGVVKRTRIYG